MVARACSPVLILPSIPRRDQGDQTMRHHRGHRDQGRLHVRRATVGWELRAAQDRRVAPGSPCHWLVLLTPPRGAGVLLGPAKWHGNVTG
jgi:hypothetical protein